MGLVIFLGIIFLAVVIFVQYKVAKLFEKIAVDKGYNEEAHAFAMCFWLGFVGYIYVASMPKLAADEIKKNTEHHSADIQVYDYTKANEIYNEATKKMMQGNENNTIECYKDAIDLFKTVPHHKNTNDLIAYCERRIQELEK